LEKRNEIMEYAGILEEGKKELEAMILKPLILL
jgi:hypothetical protein